MYFISKFLNGSASSIAKYLYSLSLYLYLYPFNIFYDFMIWKHYTFTSRFNTFCIINVAQLIGIPSCFLCQIFLLCWQVFWSGFHSGHIILDHPWKEVIPVYLPTDDLPKILLKETMQVLVLTQKVMVGNYLFGISLLFSLFPTLDVSSVLLFSMLSPNTTYIFSATPNIHFINQLQGIGDMSYAFL